MMEVGGMQRRAIFRRQQGGEQRVGLYNVGAGDCEEVGGSIVACSSGESEARSPHVMGENIEENRL